MNMTIQALEYLSSFFGCEAQSRCTVQMSRGIRQRGTASFKTHDVLLDCSSASRSACLDHAPDTPRDAAIERSLEIQSQRTLKAPASGLIADLAEGGGA